MIIGKIKPARQRPFPKWPFYAEDEIKAAINVLQSGKVNYWTGEEGCLFEKEFAQYVGTKYAIALMNGTVTLEAALHSLGIGAGDEVITSNRSFVSSTSCIIWCGATPIFVDVDLDSQNITTETIEKAISTRTKAIIATHFAGWPCEMDSILALAKAYGLYVIEDCTQAIGASYKGRPVGSWGDVAAFSFSHDKIVSTGGEGGMISTNNEVIWEKIWALKDHGKSFKTVHFRAHAPGFRWLHESFGTNWRMTEMQAAIGRVQLKKISTWLAIRRRNAAILSHYLRRFPTFRVPHPSYDVIHAYYKYYVFIHGERLKKGWDRELIIRTLNEHGIPCCSGNRNEHDFKKAFVSAGLQQYVTTPSAKTLSETSLMFLVHPTLTEKDMQEIAVLIGDIAIEASLMDL